MISNKRDDLNQIDQMNVTYTCQRCCQPLKIDSSFAAIDENILHELVRDSHQTISHSINEDEDNNSDLMYRGVAPVRLADSGSNGNGFLVIGDNSLMSGLIPACGSSSGENFAHHLKITSKLFDILSDQSDVDHPLCEECADFVMDQMEQQLRLLEEECRDYRQYLNKLENAKRKETNANDEDGKIDDESEKLENLRCKLREFQEEEARLIEGLNAIQRNVTEVKEEIAKQKLELNKMDEEENKYWIEYNNLKKQLFECHDEYQSIGNQYRYATSQYEKLKRTNVFNLTFHIWYNGNFGTINGFRLGRLPNAPVDWSEINAAWGQAVLLLHSLARKMNLTFKRFKLVPYGSHSFVESLEDKSRELPLYGSGGFRFFWNAKFDQAMVSFLDCLQQFKEEVEKGDASFCLPYRIDKGKIEDTKTGNSYSIKIQFNSEEQWTKALKFMLTNLKWALAWVTSQPD